MFEFFLVLGSGGGEEEIRFVLLRPGNDRVIDLYGEIDRAEIALLGLVATEFGLTDDTDEREVLCSDVVNSAFDIKDYSIGGREDDGFRP